MTKRANHIGYINHRLYTDVKSYEVFEEDGKMMAVEVENVQACNPEFISGGFVARCVNMGAVWNGTETKEVGEPFQLAQNRKGEWGYKSRDIILCLHGFETEGNAKSAHNAESKESDCEVWQQEDGTWSVAIYGVTKTGKPRTKFRKLGYIEDECRYFYDYNY